MMLTSLLSRRNSNRNSDAVCTYLKYLFLALFSPLLLPLACAFFPFLCALELFFRLCRRKWWRRRRRRRRRRMRAATAAEGCGGDGMVGNDETGNGQRLLERYLEDQLMLVAGSLYDQLWDDLEEGEEIQRVDVDYFDSKSPSLKLGKT